MIKMEDTAKQLKSCFKSSKLKKKVSFAPLLLQNMDVKSKERIEHNLKYKDDTIFDNISIF